MKTLFAYIIAPLIVLTYISAAIGYVCLGVQRTINFLDSIL